MRLSTPLGYLVAMKCQQNLAIRKYNQLTGGIHKLERIIRCVSIPIESIANGITLGKVPDVRVIIPRSKVAQPNGGIPLFAIAFTFFNKGYSVINMI
jgi:hypothetical protein